MRLVAESSAILTWLLDETRSADVRSALESAEVVVASCMVLLECERAIVRAERTGRVGAAAAARVRADLARVASHWTVLDVTQDVLDGARGPFPEEPVRTLDAIHLASAVVARRAEPSVALLSLDDRIRANARLLGFEVVP
jgi:predicted nucleic acid-binding protein